MFLSKEAWTFWGKKGPHSAEISMLEYNLVIFANFAQVLRLRLMSFVCRDAEGATLFPSGSAVCTAAF